MSSFRFGGAYADCPPLRVQQPSMLRGGSPTVPPLRIPARGDDAQVSGADKQHHSAVSDASSDDSSTASSNSSPALTPGNGVGNPTVPTLHLPESGNDAGPSGADGLRPGTPRDDMVGRTPSPCILRADSMRSPRTPLTGERRTVHWAGARSRSKGKELAGENMTAVPDVPAIRIPGEGDDAGASGADKLGLGTPRDDVMARAPSPCIVRAESMKSGTVPTPRLTAGTNAGTSDILSGRLSGQTHALGADELHLGTPRDEMMGRTPSPCILRADSMRSPRTPLTGERRGGDWARARSRSKGKELASQDSTQVPAGNPDVPAIRIPVGAEELHLGTPRDDMTGRTPSPCILRADSMRSPRTPLTGERRTVHWAGARSRSKGKELAGENMTAAPDVPAIRIPGEGDDAGASGADKLGLGTPRDDVMARAPSPCIVRAESMKSGTVPTPRLTAGTNAGTSDILSGRLSGQTHALGADELHLGTPRDEMMGRTPSPCILRADSMKSSKATPRTPLTGETRADDWAAAQPPSQQDGAEHPTTGGRDEGVARASSPCIMRCVMPGVGPPWGWLERSVRAMPTQSYWQGYLDAGTCSCTACVHAVRRAERKMQTQL